MIDYDGIREIVVTGLKEYLGCPIIRSNQNASPPKYPYGSYTVITPESANNGTWGEYEDGIDRKPITQTWSITFQSDKDNESVMLASKAREWLEHTGKTYLDDNDVIVQSVGSITNRDNFITVNYEYRNGFDVVFWLFDEVERPIEETGYIETADINGQRTEKQPTVDELNENLEKRLTGR